MQFLTICFVICVCGVALSTPQRNHPRITLARGKGLSNGLGIAGGSSASIKSFPYQAALSTTSGYFIGSGAIVGKKYILTSAFLVYGYTSLQVRVGSEDVDEGGQLLTTEKIILHEKFSSYSYDVALLKLPKELKYSKTVKPIKLAAKPGKNATSAVLSGFGYTSVTRGEGVDYGELQQGKESVINLDSCKSYYSYLDLDESNSCAYNPTVCACSSDYGAPLVQKKKLLGYFLGGTWCCYESQPQIYSSVPSVKKWVKDQMKGEGYDFKEDVGHYFGE